MEYLKHRSAMWWVLHVLQAIGFAACILLLVILFALFD